MKINFFKILGGLISFLLSFSVIAQVGINATGAIPDSSAMLDISSTDKGILIPRMSSTERTDINNPATGLLVFDHTTNSFWYFGSVWQEIGGAFVSQNGITTSVNNGDDFVVGADSIHHGGTGKFLFHKNKAAFRTGSVYNNYWHVDSLGFNSFAGGYNTRATNSESFAFGTFANASGYAAVAIGDNNTASASASASFGANTVSSGRFSLTAGFYTSASGDYATAFGNYSSASGKYAIASGNRTEAVGDNATAFGRSTLAQADYSTAIGYQANAYSYGETAIGLFNTTYTAVDTNSFNPVDRLFVIGNGTGTNDRSDAMVVYKSGNTEIHGTLMIDSAYTFPVVDGSSNQVLTTDGNGIVTWSDNTDSDNQELLLDNHTLSISGGSNPVSLNGYMDNTDSQELSLDNHTLSITGNSETVSLSSYMDNTDRQSLSLSNDEISISNGNSIDLNSAFLKSNGLTYGTNTSDDFVFGASSLDHSSGSERKFFLDKSTGAFRAGTVTGSDWNDSNRGLYSVAMGWNTKASGSYTVALGYNTDATDAYAISIGTSNVANELFAVAIGNGNDIDGSSSVALGSANDLNDRYGYALGNSNVINGEYAATVGTSSAAVGDRSMALGYGIEAESYGELALGMFNTSYTPISTIRHEEADRLFVLGNGLNKNDRSDAIRILKDGRSYFYGDAAGTGEFVMTIDNTTNNNGSRNNGLLIKVGHSTYNSNNRSSFVEFESPDGDYCGRVRQTGNSSVSYQNSSDIRLKENIRPTQYGLEDILNIQVRDYNYKTDPESFRQTGFIAQQLHTVFPIVVEEGGEDAKTNPWMVDYAGLTPLLVKGIQDQQALIQLQSQKINQLETELKEVERALTLIDQLKAEYAEMKAMLEQIQAEGNDKKDVK